MQAASRRVTEYTSQTTAAVTVSAALQSVLTLLPGVLGTTDPATASLLSAATDSAAAAARGVDVCSAADSGLRPVLTDRSPVTASQPPQPAASATAPRHHGLCASVAGSQRKLDGRTAFVCTQSQQCIR